MIKPDIQVVRGFAHIAQNVPQVKDWLIEWANMELTRLPQTISSMAVAQGRCQVLEELRKLLNESPALAAQPRQGSG